MDRQADDAHEISSADDVPTFVGGDFNVIPEDIDRHKPSSWIHDALFQPEPRACYRVLLGWDTQMFFDLCIQVKAVISHSGITSDKSSNTTVAFVSITSYCLQRSLINYQSSVLQLLK